MAYCAEIDNQGIVKRVIVVEDYYGDLTCEQWCEKTYGGIWKKTSYNTKGGKHGLGKIPFRGNYAGIGMKYDSELDMFVPINSPFLSWKLNKETGLFEAPNAKPEDENDYSTDDWNELELKWNQK